MLAGEIPTEEPKAIVRNLLMGQKVGEALLTRRGQPTVRVRIRQTPDPSVSSEAVAQLRQASLRAHGRLRREVEAELAAREREADQTMSQYQVLQKQACQKQAGNNVSLAYPDDTAVEVRDLEIRDQEVRDLEGKQEGVSDAEGENDATRNSNASNISEASDSSERGAEPA